MKQRHSNRLDATRKTGHFWDYVRHAFAGILLLLNQRNPYKPPKLTELAMTNFKESDSIPEKPEVVKTEPKSSGWNWKTATITIAIVVVNARFRLSAKLRPIRRRLLNINGTGVRKPP